MIYTIDSRNMEYFYYPPGSDKKYLTRDSHTMENYPPELRKKVKLVGHFHDFMSKHLYQPQDYTFVDLERVRRLDFMSKYVRTKFGVLFRLSNRTVQINFFDHIKLILSEDARVVTLIDKDRQLRTYSLIDALADPNSLTFIKVKQARDIIRQVFAPSTSSSSTSVAATAAATTAKSATAAATTASS
jgi:hypothetical protein